MERLTAEQITRQTDYIESSRANRTAINKLYRAQDDSHLYPINGRFSAADRAIKRVQKLMHDYE